MLQLFATENGLVDVGRFRRILLFSCLVLALIDGVRRVVWRLRTSADIAWLSELVLSAALHLPWLIFAAGLLEIARRFKVMQLTGPKALSLYALVIATMALLHPVILGTAFVGLDVPGAKEAGVWTLWIDVFLRVALLDVCVGVLISTVVLFWFHNRFAKDANSILDLAKQNADCHLTSLAVRKAGKKRIIPVGRVLWIGASGNYCDIHTNNNSYLLRANIGRLQARLDPHEFLRIHRAVLVNRPHVTELVRTEGVWQIALGDGIVLPVSRRKLRDVRAALR